MTPRSRDGRLWFGTIAFLSVVTLVVVAGLAFALNRSAGTRYSAMFTSVVGLYQAADVRILGVPVGTVDELRPQGRLVRVDFHVDSGIQIPEAALAMVVAPTVVADRYLQLGPAYTGGPTLPAGAVIPKERTASPAEFDDLLASVQKLATSLGPQGVNSTGALSDALSTLARNVDGNGRKLNTTLDNVSQAVSTLNASRDDLFGTIRNLQSFTTNLKENDGQVRDFTRQFAQVSGYLAGERKNLGETLEQLSEVLGEVAVFVHDNRAGIKSNVDKLGEILGTINGERLALEQVLDTAPLGLGGLVNGYNASAGTFDTRANLLQSLLCTLVNLPGLGPSLPPELVQSCTSLAGLVRPPALPANAAAGPEPPPPLPMMITSPAPSQPARPPLLGDLVGGGR